MTTDDDVYDYAIVGAGVSGLVLAWLLCDSSLREKRLLVIDGAHDDDELRTLSFWSDGPMALESLVTKRWSDLVVHTECSTHSVRAVAHTYRTLFFADLQRETKRRVLAGPENRIVDGRLRELVQDDSGATLTVGAETFRARWVMDSRFRLKGLGVDTQKWHFLKQYFYGWIVEAPTDAFEPSQATLLDFRAPTRPGTGFFYVLPFSETRALVELVTLEPVEAEPMVRGYLESRFGIREAVLVDREAGTSPMTEQPFPWREGKRVRKLGVAAGRLKPSTGYALTRIVEDGASIVRSLEKHGHPFCPPKNQWLFRWLDGVLLELWERSPERIPPVFARLFAKNPVDRVFRFLDEKIRLWELFLLVLSLPKWPFVRAAVVWLMRRTFSKRLPSHDTPRP